MLNRRHGSGLFFRLSSSEDTKALEMKEKMKGKTLKSSEKSNAKGVEETVALMYKPLSLVLLLWLLYLLFFFLVIGILWQYIIEVKHCVSCRDGFSLTGLFVMSLFY